VGEKKAKAKRKIRKTGAREEYVARRKGKAGIKSVAAAGRTEENAFWPAERATGATARRRGTPSEERETPERRAAARNRSSRSPADA